jgi:RHS repeat-associated protein
MPANGAGTAGANYDQTDFGYDSTKRRNRTVSPGGTITFQVFGVRRHVVATYVGTDDSGATETDPTGDGADPNNNMVLVTSYQYDHGQAGGDGNLTEQTQHVDADTARVTQFVYDWRNRRTATDGEIDFYEQLTYDNFSRVTRTERYDTTAQGNLIARNDTLYDDRGRVYRTIRYAVDPSTGTVDNAMVDNTWYDAAGNVIKSLPSGAKLFSKTVYDGIGRQTTQYTGYDLDETTYSQAGTVVDDTILEQTETDYDNASNVIQTTRRQRYHNAPASQTGALGDASTDPKARVTYSAQWHDAIGREIATGNYGTNGGAAFVRPNTIPERSDTVLVTTIGYNDAGEAFQTIDPAGREDRQFFDAAGRSLRSVQNYVDGIVDIDHPDEDVTVETSYGPDGQLLTLVAKNPATGDQVTRYVYGTTLTDSEIARSDLLRAEIYPDSDDTADPLGDGPDEVYDRIEHRYNRQGQRTETKDQNETVHAFDYDKLGRRIHDRVTSLGGGVDGTARRISTTYDVSGLVEGVATYDDSAVGSGNVRNELVFEYNDLGMPVKEYQEHAGVQDGNTLYVQYDYDTTASGGVFTHGLRPISMRYPNGRRIHLDYGANDGMDDALGRVAALRDDDSGSPGDMLAEYAYLGIGRIVVEDYVEPEVELNYDSGTPGEYAGFDRFARVIDHRWYDYGASTDRDRYTYGYDRASNRLYRENTLTSGRDELYGHDQVSRLIEFQRGELNANKDGITGTPAREEDWSLDMTGNWPGYVQKTSGSTDLDQGRTHNPVNEITAITAATGTNWADPEHDRNGNMTTIPKPANLADGLTATYDAWNRLVEVKDGQTVIARYEYDGLNRRIKRHVDSGAPSSPSGIDTYVHDYYNSAWQILETRQSDTQSAEPETLQPKHQYVWSQRYIDAAVLRDENTGANGLCDDRRLYFLNDANFNVTGLLDTAGDAVERYVYSPYGVATIYDATWTNSRSASSYDNVTLYTGRELDAETGLYYYRNRYYSADLGRFVSRDPIGYEGGDVNVYRYIGSNPSIRTDPEGKDYGECKMFDTICKRKGSSGSTLACIWACRCPDDSPFQFNHKKPNFDRGVEEREDFRYPCTGNIDEDEQSRRDLWDPTGYGDCCGRGGGKPSRKRKGI